MHRSTMNALFASCLHAAFAQAATEVGVNSLSAVTPGETIGTLYTFGVGSNKTKQHLAPLASFNSV